MPAYAKFEVPDEVMKAQLELLEKIKRNGGKVKIGVNETTKAVERGNAKLVLIALDVSPEEIVMHLPVLCEEKGVPYSYVPNKKDLGKAAGIDVSASSVAIVDPSNLKEELDKLVERINEIKK